MPLERYAAALAELAAMPRRRQLFRDDFARLLGVRWLSKAGLPEPDGHVLEAGKARPVWYPPTVRKFLEGKVGRGVGGGRRPKPAPEPE